ncbi:MAG: cytochrome bc complex cytochrome b subunit [Phycisphaerae bacterium]|jgi:quinol-cytochrome oxidoreductase complex cytochrome b subunit
MGDTNWIKRFLDARFDTQSARAWLDKQMYKRLPPHISWFHVFGSLSLLLFVSQTITGILLLMYYRPTPEAAHESIQYITAEVHFGWLYRQVHAWGASLMILAVLLHMIRTFFSGGYKKPRELTWVTGVLLFMFTITFGFTGYLLPWNQIAFWATTVGTESANKVPVIGGWLQYFLRGGNAVTGETLSRFFVVHVIILPWLLTGLIVAHLALMRLKNLATLEPVDEETPIPPERGIPFFPVHVAKEAVVVVLMLAVLVTLSIAAPWEIGEPADPLSTPAHIKPEWYFLPSYQLLKYFEGPYGAILGIIACSVPFILLFIWPFLDRGKHRHPKRRPIAVGIGILGLLAAIFLGYLGHISETEVTFFGKRYHIDLLGRPHAIVDDQPTPPEPHD